MKFNKDNLNKNWVAYTIATCSAVVLFVLLTHLNIFAGGFARLVGYCSPVIIGVIIAYVLDPLVKLFEQYVFRRIKKPRLRRNVSIIVTIVALLVFIVILLVALVPEVINSIVGLVSNMDSYASTLQALMKRLGEFTGRHDIDISELIDMGQNLVNRLAQTIPQNFNRILNTSWNIGKGVFVGVIASIMAVYFLVDKDRLVSGIRRLMRGILPSRRFQASLAFWGRCNSILIRYIVFDLLDGLIIGVLNFIFMMITRMPFAILISVVVGVTNLAPTFGPILGALIGAFILVLNNPWHALLFLIFTLIMQTVDGYIIKPKLFGGQLGVSSVWILICIIVGGRMFGVPGILVAIPAAAITDHIYHEWIIKKLEERAEKKRAK